MFMNFFEKREGVVLLVLLALALALRAISFELIRAGVFAFMLFIVLYSYHRYERSFISQLMIAAFSIRLLSALFNEFVLLFPEKYYSDAIRYHTFASEISKAWLGLEFSDLVGSFGHLNYARFMAIFFLIFGGSTLLPKIINSFFAALSLYPIWRIASMFAGEKGSKLATLLFAFWPSAIYFTSENLRESLIIFIFFWSFYFSLRFLETLKPIDLFYAIALSAINGLLRPELMVLTSLGFILLGILMITQRKTVFLYILIPVSLMIFIGWLISPIIPFGKHFPTESSGDLEYSVKSLKKELESNRKILETATESAHPEKVEEIESTLKILEEELEFAKKSLEEEDLQTTTERLEGDKLNSARENLHRLQSKYQGKSFFLKKHFLDRGIVKGIISIRQNIIQGAKEHPDSALFEDIEFNSNFDVIKFIPTTVFHTFFMPLPGLYPLEGKFRLILASIENVFLFFLAVMALRNIFLIERDIKLYYTVLFLLLAMASHSLLEPDLGTALRHKILYLPLILSLACGRFLFKGGAWREWDKSLKSQE
jgi:hypothetical protein